jgi:hypothetical protein
MRSHVTRCSYDSLFGSPLREDPDRGMGRILHSNIGEGRFLDLLSSDTKRRSTFQVTHADVRYCIIVVAR